MRAWCVGSNGSSLNGSPMSCKSVTCYSSPSCSSNGKVSRRNLLLFSIATVTSVVTISMSSLKT